MSIQSTLTDFPRLLPRRIEDLLISWSARVGGGALVALSVLVWLSLATWSVGDPSLSHAVAGRPANWLGPLGAIVADLLLQTVGLASAVAIVAPLWWGCELMRRERIAGWRSKLVYLTIAVLAFAACFGALPRPSGFALQHGLGGFIGRGLYELSSGLVALVSSAIAGPITGLATAAAGGWAMARSLGLGRAELVPALGIDRAISRSMSAGFTRVAPAWVSGQGYDGAGSGASGADALNARVAPDLGSRPATPPGDAGDRVVPSLGGLSPLGGDQGVLPFPETSDRAGERLPVFLTSQATAATMPVAAMPVAIEDHFDAATDAGSRQIASRFAPANACPAAVVGAVPAAPVRSTNTSVANGVVRGNLLGGMSFARPAGYRTPSLNLLARATATKPGPEFTQTVLRGSARLLEDVLADFGVKGEVKDIRPGPVVTLFEMEPARGTKSSRVIGLADDIARSMSAASARVAVVPGRNALGIELPNARRETVYLRELFDADAYRNSTATLPIALGKSIGGEPIIADLARMPHLLVAGTTGSGKSVGVNAMILSLVYKLSPEQCRLLMIDPKMLELSVYNGIPHLLTPVVTDPAKAVAALNWAVSEMEERYKRMAELGVRNIDVYNNRVRNAQGRGEQLARTVQTGFDAATGQPIYEQQALGQDPLPYIVIVVDEFADLMMVAGKDIEAAVQRLAQMARAAGIHLIMATQRPSVDVITGTIKANFPTRISFKVASKIDSRTILNEQGAEQLLGQGDMLYSNGGGALIRVHGAFVKDDEVEAVAAALREQGQPDYIEIDTDRKSQADAGDEPVRGNGPDDLYDKAVAIVLRDRKASTSYIQRRMSIGYNRAADLIERMEREGVVSPANAVGKRDILLGSSGGSEGRPASDLD